MKEGDECSGTGHLLILTAGSCSRFRSAVPKLLAPVTRGQGMLELLLHTLLQDLRAGPHAAVTAKAKL